MRRCPDHDKGHWEVWCERILRELVWLYGRISVEEPSGESVKELVV